MSTEQDVQDDRWYLTGAKAGPAGVATANIGAGVVAEIDISSGTPFSFVTVAPALADAARAAIHRLSIDDIAVDAVRRIALATAFMQDDPANRRHWWILDRLHARIQLEQHEPAFAIGFDDTDLTDVIDAIETQTYVRTDSNARLLDAALASVFEKTSRPPTQLATLPPSRRVIRTGDLGPVEVPVLVTDSSGFDLDWASYGDRLSADWDRGILELKISVSDPAAWADEVTLYLLNPGVPAPLHGIARPVVEDARLVARFASPQRTNWGKFEIAVLPRDSTGFMQTHGLGKDQSARLFRALAVAEVHSRTAERLNARRSAKNQALKRVKSARDVYRQARAKGVAVPDYFFQRLDVLEREIGTGTGNSGLLGDMDISLR